MEKLSDQLIYIFQLHTVDNFHKYKLSYMYVCTSYETGHTYLNSLI